MAQDDNSLVLHKPRATVTKKTLVWVLAAATLLAAANSADEKRLSVYAPVATYSLSVTERNGREYVGLLELLEPLGRVGSEWARGRWTIRFNSVGGEFIADRSRAKIQGRDFDLGAPFLVENARGLIPISAVVTLLPRFLGTQVNFRENARRLFIGDVALQPSFQLETGPPERLLLNFTAPVNPTISTEPGRVRMVFKRDPIVSPGSQTISFDSKTITHANYSEGNGVAELDVAASSPLMATFANGGKTIILAAAPSSAGGDAPTPGSGPAPSQSAPSGGGSGTQPVSHRPLAVVDAAHGGDERGAALSNQLVEKDVTLGWARLLRHELEVRGFAVLMVRDGDTAVTLDQRASEANAARASVYISLHVSSQGNGAHVYSALLPVEDPSKGAFRAWNAAQTPVLPISRAVAGAVLGALQKKQIAARGGAASLRPLNNLLMPAVAVELAPGSNGPDLTSANYQQQAAAAIAEGVVAMRDRLGVQP